MSDLEHLKKELKDAEIQSEVNRKRADKLETLIPEKRAEAEVELVRIVLLIDWFSEIISGDES